MTGHPADCIQDPGYCKTLRHQHALIRALSNKYPALAYDSLSLPLGHSAGCVQDTGYCKTLRHQHALIRAFSGKY